MRVQHNIPLRGYTSLRAGGPAAKLIILEAEDSLAETAVEHSGQPLWILGYGSNCLISDQGLPGVTIINRAGSLSRVDTARVKVDSGYDWDEFVQYLIGGDLWGLEFTSGIQGGVGAAVAGNIAAYGHQVADCFVEAEVLDSQSGQVEVWRSREFKFAYRASQIQAAANRHKIILNATFKLSRRQTSELEYDSAVKVAAELGLKPDSLKNRRQIIIETRRRAGSLLSNPTAGPWTAGSFFKNPLVSEDQIEAILAHEEQGVSRRRLLRQNLLHGGSQARVSAAHVLLAAGFKRGQSWGQVRLHPDHILKIENLGQAAAQEIYDVVQHIIVQVRAKLGITLEPEVRFMGEFQN